MAQRVIKSNKRALKRKTKKLITPVKIGTDHIRGSINAPINIVEYGDYECPYTGMAYPIVKEIMKQFNTKVYFVFRIFLSLIYIPMHSTRQKQQKLLRPGINSGKCMTIFLNIRKHWMIIISCSTQK